MTKIEFVSAGPDRAGRYHVRLDDGSVLRLYRQTMEDFGIYAGKEMETDDVQALQKAAGQMSARMRAVRIVSASNVSKKDLQQRLVSKGENPDQAAQAVAWMEELDLIDDRRTAEQVVSSCARKGYGLARAKQALYEKRIPKQYWEEALQDYPDQTEAITSFLRARLGEDWDDKTMRRALDALIRRGHTYPQIRAALQQLQLDLEDFREE